MRAAAAILMLTIAAWIFASSPQLWILGRGRSVRLTAWLPSFAEAQMSLPANARFEFARKVVRSGGVGRAPDIAAVATDAVGHNE
jgi:hypothetical protein